MEIQMFNIWYFVSILISIGIFLGLYFILKNKKKKTIYIVLSSILFFGLLLHFLKFFIPPYSTDTDRLLRDAWFVNICGANILLFPFIFLTKNKCLKDYMFYIGLISGIISILYPMEPMLKVEQSAEWLDIIRFYIHHNILWQVPLLMVLLKLHKLDYRRTIFVPMFFLGVMLFIMINQILQSELGFIGMRGDNIFDIPYKNSSLIWGPEGNAFEIILTALCPPLFKTIPFGEYAGQEKYWPWFWLIVPAFVYITPLCLLISLIFDYKHFKNDLVLLKYQFYYLGMSIKYLFIKPIQKNDKYTIKNNEISLISSNKKNIKKIFKHILKQNKIIKKFFNNSKELNYKILLYDNIDEIVKLTNTIDIDNKNFTFIDYTKNIIFAQTFDLYNNIKYQNKFSVQEYSKIISHEIVYLYGKKFINNYDNVNVIIKEGLANYLSNKKNKDINYVCYNVEELIKNFKNLKFANDCSLVIVKKLFENYKQIEILEIIRGKIEINLDNIIDKCNTEIKCK